MFSGKPLANMIFKILSEDVVAQGIFFAQDQKLGHYFKVAPRTVFVAQGIAAILGALTQTGVTLWMLGNIDDICSLDQADGFSCPNGRTVFSSSVIWGLIGPGRLYSAGKIYSGLLHFFWIGALIPLVTWGIWKYTKNDIWKKVNWPLIFVGVSVCSRHRVMVYSDRQHRHTTSHPLQESTTPRGHWSICCSTTGSRLRWNVQHDN